jgi:pimeloyl-ACP methyl ester carboxylesterase/GNAT superfamily N-acetyltransferase
MTTDGPGVALRRATAADGQAIGDLWLDAWYATFDFPPGHPDDACRQWLAETLVPSTESWVAVDRDDRAIALLALSETMVEQLYVAPAWIGQGIGSRLIELARERRPDGLDLYCFAVNTRARRFYEGHGFWAVAFGDGSRNEEGQPDIRYAWRPSVTAPDLSVPSPDGTAIAVFRSGTAGSPPLVLVHGASADHTTFRVLGPRLAATHDLYAIDRRGRGASGDTSPYAIEREFEDVAAVAEAVAARTGRARVDVLGHSYGGRCALGAALLTSSIGRVISYEGAPTPPGERYGDAGLADELAALAEAGENERLLERFMTDVVGMSREDLDRYRADPVWPRRVAAAPTIARELRVEAGAAAGLEHLGAVRQPVLQLLGSASVPAFASATHALDRRLQDGRIVVIAGARHAAHHTHPDAVVDALQTFLTDPPPHV